MAQPTIQSKQAQHHCSGFGIYYIYRWYMHGIHWYTRGIRWYTLVYAGVRWYTHGIRAVYAWYTRGFCGIRVVYARYTRGIRAVYAWYTRGFCGIRWYTRGIRLVFAWYTRGIRWYTLMTPQPQNGENRQRGWPPAVKTASGDDRLRWRPPAVMTASYIALLFSIHDLKLSLAFKMEGGKFTNHRKLNMN